MTKNSKIILLILIVLLLGAYIFYYSFKSKSPPGPNQNELTVEERNQAVAELKENISKSPPLTDKERAKATEELRKIIADQNK